jgi:hypothetical protein
MTQNVSHDLRRVTVANHCCGCRVTRVVNPDGRFVGLSDQLKKRLGIEDY